MTYTTTIPALVLSGLFATSALAQNQGQASDLEHLQKIENCITEAVDAVQIPGTRAYYDPDDQGYKKYLESESVFAGISAFINPYGENEGVITDTVHFMTKYYQEDTTNNEGEDFTDMVRSISLTFTQEATIHQNDTGAMSYNPKHMISDFDTRPEYSEEDIAARDWAHDAAGQAALIFTMCMDLPPYEPSMFAGNRPLQPAIFPD